MAPPVDALDSPGATDLVKKPPPAELASLRKQRGLIKSRVTIFSNHLAGLKSENLDNIAIADLMSRLSRFADIYNEFYHIQMSIQFDFAEFTSIDAEECELNKFETGYHQCVARANNFIDIFNGVSNSAQTHNGQRDILNLSQRQGSDRNVATEIRLPKISLPTFSGDYESWIEFKATFETLVHSQPINSVTKFHHLRAALSGDAINVIKSFTISDASYADAWKILCERYDNNKLLLHNHIIALFNIEPIQRESSTRIRSLIDNFSRHLSALKHLNQPVEHWGSLLKHFILSKLDVYTNKEWESKYPSIDATYEQLISFLRERANVLETVESKRSDRTVGPQQTRTQTRSQTRCLLTNSKRSSGSNCPSCKAAHSLQHCPEFLKLKLSERLPRVKALRLCTNCLFSGHGRDKCPSRFRCRSCGGLHHSLIHQTNESTAEESQPRADASSSGNISNDSVASPTTSASISCYTNSFLDDSSHVLLTTALVNVHDNDGKLHCARALLDAASQSHFITSAFCKRLNLKIDDLSLAIHGVHEAKSYAQGRISALISSRHENFSTKLNFWVLPCITELNAPLAASKIRIPLHLNLADSEFYKRGPIDLLLGSGIFWHLLSNGQIQIDKTQPVWQNTRLGWVIGGPVPASKTNSIKNYSAQCHVTSNNDCLESSLRRFWELEDCSSLSASLTSDEELCEYIFSKTVTRSNGRYIVTIPVRDDINTIGNSYDIARRRLHSMERRFEHNMALRQEYCTFMSEYEKLGHMSRAPAKSNQTCIYLPHHAVLKPDSRTTKLRVVFDGSAKTSNNKSLNHYQLVGPTLQQDLLSILIRFRSYKIAITSDIAKMYRQVLIEPSQRDFQRILWRDKPSDPICEYQLNTVTYGTASASFLAIRCIHHLADECNDSAIRHRIKRDFYVDDFITGAESLADAIHLCDNVNRVLLSGKFELRKWNSNSDALLQHLSGQSNDCYDFNKNEITKTLGLLWSAAGDYFSFQISAPPSFEQLNTKRTILSDISKVFDPLGFLAPVTIFSKIFMQDLWRLECGWDTPIERLQSKRYQCYRQSLLSLNRLQINRFALASDPNRRIVIHGFCDASKKAYGACIYACTTSTDGVIISQLICSKTKVAPLRPTTIPRLELCAAVLLARLFNIFCQSIEFAFSESFMWTDSSIVLGWLRQRSTTLQTFVRNRICEIIKLTHSTVWRHVATHHNPADLLSRGVTADALLSSSLWWHGPEWLQLPKNEWPLPRLEQVELPELRRETTCALNKNQGKITLININNFSNLSRLERIIAYIFRFINKTRKQFDNSSNISLNTVELIKANEFLVKQTQEMHYATELFALRAGQAISNKSTILKLSPFLLDGIIRVGGRLQNSELHFNVRHPILLPAHAHLTKLIFEREHNRLLHAGTTALINSTRDRYWVPNARSIARKIIHSCIICFKAKPRCVIPKMGNLPPCRVLPAPPFHMCGTDFAGPFLLKTSQLRNAKSFKAYVAIFICMATTAVHLELVTSLTTEAFVMTLRRFISRRGHPSQIFSDNATNFVGANNHLREIVDFLNASKAEINNFVTKHNIQWNFSPPRAPHFGGLWEAGVKRMKYHLKRVLGEQSLTYESFVTLLCQIEAIMNSRPLSPMSSDPNDLDPLTPAHFLVGRKLTSLADKAICVPESRLNNFQRIQTMVQGYWTRWSKEYLGELLSRKRWASNNNEFESQPPAVGQLVLIAPDQETCKWQTGRIIHLHQGSDNIPRVATLRTQRGLMKRPVVKLAILPTQKDQDDRLSTKRLKL